MTRWSNRLINCRTPTAELEVYFGVCRRGGHRLSFVTSWISADQFSRSSENPPKNGRSESFSGRRGRKIGFPRDPAWKLARLPLVAVGSRRGRRRDFKEVFQIARPSRGKRHSLRVFRTWDAIVTQTFWYRCRVGSYHFNPAFMHSPCTKKMQMASVYNTRVFPRTTGSASCVDLPILRNDLNKHRSCRLSHVTGHKPPSIVPFCRSISRSAAILWRLWRYKYFRKTYVKK